MNGLGDDLRSAVWQLYHYRWTTLACIVCFAIAIAVVTSTASILDGVLLRPLPYAEPDRLVMVRSENVEKSEFDQMVSRMDLFDWQNECMSMQLSANMLLDIDLPYEGGYRRATGMYVTPDFFDVLKIKPYLGRTFRDFEATGHTRQIMLSTRIWRELYDAEPGAVGGVVEVSSFASYPGPGSISHALTGLLPEDTRFVPCSSFIERYGHGPDRELDFVLPLSSYPGKREKRDWRDFTVVGRLNPGYSLSDAQAEMTLICHRLAKRYPVTNEGWTASVVPMDDYVFADVRPFALAGFVAATLVFTIAIGNVAHLLLVQFQKRRGEMAIRAAVGASPWALLRLASVEFAIILGGGLVTGLLLARFATPWLLRMAPAEMRWLPTTLSFPVIAVVLTLSSVAGAIVWWLAMRCVMSPNLTPLLGISGCTASLDERSVRTLRRMTQLQLVATYLLVLGAGVLWFRTRELAAIDPGFDPENRLTMQISLPLFKHEWKHNSIFCNDVIRRVRNLPGVFDAGAILGLPMGGSALLVTLSVEGRPEIRATDLPPIYIRVVTDEYFETMGIPLIQGRKFNETDAIGEIGVNRTAIISKTMAERCWPGKNPVGRRFRIGTIHSMQVIGVVGDVMADGVELGSTIDIYYPEKLFPQYNISFVVHTEAEPMSMIGPVREEILASDPDAHIMDAQPLTRHPGCYAGGSSVWFEAFVGAVAGRGGARGERRCDDHIAFDLEPEGRVEDPRRVRGDAV